MSRFFRRTARPTGTHRSASLRARLLLQALERRIAPAAFTVTNTGDSGMGSGTSGDLRYCITQSDSTTGPNTIDATGVTGTITLTSSLPAITQGLTITGPGASLLAVSGANSFRVFTTSPGAGNTVSMIGMTITGGNSPTAAGIDMTNGNLTLTGMTVSNNTATGNGDGGAGIYNASNGTVIIINSHVDNNTAGSSGGGIFDLTNGPINIANSTVSNNSVGPGQTGSGSGGGIYSLGDGLIHITNSTISNNTAWSEGGGIDILTFGNLTVTGSTITSNRTQAGGAIYARQSTVSITNSILANNMANFAGGGAVEAVYGANLTMNGTTVSGNTAVTNGGGIYFFGTGALTITNSTLANNIAGSGSTTAGSGGAIRLEYESGSGPVKIISSTITGNSAASTGTTSNYGGGGISAESGWTGTLTLDNTIVSGNSAAAGNRSMDISAAAISAKYSALGTSTGYSLTDQGGNLTGANASAAALKLGSLAGNSGPTPTIAITAGSTAIDAGDPALDGTTDQQGVMRPADTNPATNPNNRPDIGAYERLPGIPQAVTTVPNVNAVNAPLTYEFTVAYTTETAMNYSTINGDNNAVTVTPPSGLSPVNVTFVGASPNANAATLTATYQFTFPAGLSTGADDGVWQLYMAANQVFNTGGVAVPAGQIGSFTVTVPRTLTVTNTGDTGAGSGQRGDLRYCINQANADAPLADQIVFSNTTAGGTQTNFYDGAVHTITINSALPAITDPAAVIGPGANVLTITRSVPVYATFSIGTTTTAAATISGMTVSGGNTTGYGVSTSGNVTISGVVMQGNNAVGNTPGGGIYSFGPQLTITNSTIWNNSNNSADGGGIGIGSATNITVVDCTIANNSTTGSGGGIGAGGGGTLTIMDSTISGNTAGRGGGVYAYGGCNISDSTIVKNAATDGGGIFSRGIFSQTLTLISDTLTGNTAADSNGAADLGGGGIVARGSTVLDNTIVSNNVSANGYDDISVAPSVSVSAKYSAIGTTNGFQLTDQGHNLIGYNLLLGPLQNNGGPTQTEALLAATPAIGVGDPNLDGTTDQRGVVRPQQMGMAPQPDIGAYERTPNTLSASASVSNVTSIAAPATYQFTVTYADDVPINAASINSGNVTITVPHGVPAVAVALASVNTGNPDQVVATYQFTAPGGAWSSADDGSYTVNMVAGQVTDADGSVAAGLLASFSVTVPMVFTVTNVGDADGPGSLRAAITAADAIFPLPSAIVFSNATAGGTTNFYDGTTHTIFLAAALPGITSNVTITGPGATLLTITPSSGGTFQLMPIGPVYPYAGTTTVKLSGFTLSGAQTTMSGAAIGDSNAAALTLTDVTIKNNSSGSADGGGGIFLANGGNLTLVDCTIQSNTSNGGSGGGGGIDMYDAGLLSITDCTVSGNSTFGRGGGINIENALGALSTVMIEQSTIADNSAGYSGGGLALGLPVSQRFGASTAVNLLIDRSTLAGNTSAGIGGGLFLPGEIGGNGATIVNSTIVSNTATSGGGIATATQLGKVAVVSSTITGNSATSTDTTDPGRGGGGISLYSGTTATGAYSTIALDNTIVSGNNAANGNQDIAETTTGLAVNISAVYSAIGSTNGFTYAPGTGDLPIGANLNLQPLANNGGPTQTIALGPGSAAINAGDPMTTLTTDQRGYARIYGSTEDIGAYEVQPFTVAKITVGDGLNASNPSGFAERSEVRSISVTFSGPVTFAGGNAAAAFQLDQISNTTTDFATPVPVANLNAVTTNASGQTVVTLTFSTTGNTNAQNTGPIDSVSAQNGGAPSLNDGRFSLTISGANVSGPDGLDMAGNATTAGSNYVSPTDTLGGGAGQIGLYRLFGDAGGDGVDDQLALGAFRATLNSSIGDPAYVACLDADNSGVIDQIDLGQFRARFNSSVFPVSTPRFTPAPAPPALPIPVPILADAPVLIPLLVGAPVAASAPPTAPAVEVNDGSVDPSEVRSMTVTFSGPVMFSGGNANAAAAFQLNHLTDGNNVSLSAAVSTNSQARAVVILTFAGPETDPLSSENGASASLADGRYSLTIFSGSVTIANGVALNGGSNYVSPTDTQGSGPGQLQLYRLSCDTGGGGVVDPVDQGKFRSAFNSSVGDPLYLAYLDADDRGVIDQIGLGQFGSRGVF